MEKVVVLDSNVMGMQPWVSSPYHLISWWDMEQFAAAKFCRIAGNLAALGYELRMDGKPRPISSRELQQTANSLEAILPDLDEIGLKTASLQVVDAVRRLRETSAWISPQVAQLLTCLNVAINSEMSTHLFMRIYPDRARFYEADSLFGSHVEDRFPVASRDIKAAGSCYASDRNTACVMHLMRVLEVGLQALATPLGVMFERREWENVINDIEAKIKNINGPHAGLQWKKDQKFYSEAAKDFRYLKNAWRNHAMHVREHYDASEARMILDHTQAFMLHLAENAPVGSTINL